MLPAFRQTARLVYSMSAKDLVAEKVLSVWLYLKYLKVQFRAVHSYLYSLKSNI